MTTTENTAISWTTSGLTPGTTANASDVLNPLNDAATDMADAREKVSVSANDTHRGHLYDKITVGTGIGKTIANASGNETVELSFSSGAAASGWVPVADGAGGINYVSPATIGVAEGAIDVVVTAGESLSLRDVVYVAPGSSTAFKAVNSIVMDSIIGIVVESGGISSGNTGIVRVLGEVGGFSGLTPWQPVYVSSTAGQMTQTEPAPSSGGAQIAWVLLGYAYSATNIILRPKPIRYMKRDDVAHNGTLAVSHHGGKPAVSTTFNHAYGADVVSGGTASASTVASTLAAANAFDNNPHTVWSTTTTSGWLKYDFGSGVTKTVTRYTLQAFSRDGFAGNEPASWTLEGSNDNSSWDTLDTQSSISGWNETPKGFTFSNATAYRYYRLNVSANGGGTVVQVSSLTLHEDTTAYDESVVVGRESGGWRDVGVVYTSGTVKTFRNVSGETQDMTVVVEVVG